MGITGLLPFLKKASREASIKDFRGCTVAIDSYCWLHKGAFACADKLALGEKTDQYVYYCMKYVNTLLSYGIKPILVFDGARLPSKEGVERERRERRETYRKKAAQLLREGRRAEARECLQRCVDITPTMALELMNACRAKGVDCIVAPYEADSQLAYLNKTGIAQIIISEDSDLILFGCKKVMYKMDFSGNGILVEQEHLPRAMDLKADVYTFDKFRYMCILSGCDYLPSLPGIGLGKANKLFKLTRQTDMTTVLKKLPTTLKMSQLDVTAEYLAGFKRADNTFLYQLCYDPKNRKQVPLNPYPDNVDPRELEYAGPYMSKERALQMALGNLDHYSGQQIADFDPEKSPTVKKSLDTPSHMLSIWDPYYRPMKILPTSGRTSQTPAGGTSTKGREVVVKAVTTRRATPTQQLPKRTREPEDPAALTDLAGVYGDGSESPESKRPRCEWDEDEGSSSQNCPEQSNTISTPYSTTSPPRESLREIQQNCESTSPQKREHAKVDTSPVKEPSPKVSRNRFALLANSKKRKFDLNAGRPEVKSRFFTEDAKPLPKTNFFHSLGETFPGDKDTNGGKSESVKTEMTAAVEATTTPQVEQFSQEGAPCESDSVTTPRNRPGIGRAIFAKEHSGVAKQSPHGSFGFGNKLQMFKSTFDKPQTGSSPLSLKQFKPVTTAVTAVSNKENAAVNIKSELIGDVIDVTDDDVITTTVTSGDRLGMASGQDPDTPFLKSSKGSTEEPSLPSLPTLGSGSKKAVGTPQAACRPVGLSKSTSKAGVGRTKPDKQANITSFFSQFANKKKT